MKICLDNNNFFRNMCSGNPILFGQKEFENAVVKIGNDILNSYDFHDEKIGLIGVARGALPLLTAISHYVNNRNISIMQIQMTNSDKIKDYGETRFINEMVDESVNSFIIIEDVVSHGRCSNFVINRLKNIGKKVLNVYSIIMNEDFEELNYDQDIDLKYVYKITNEQWIQFFWEKTPQITSCEI